MNADLILEKLKTYPLAILCAVLGLICFVVLYLRSGLVSDLSIRETELSAQLRVIEENVKNSANLQSHLDEVLSLAEAVDTRLFYPEQRAININFFYNIEKQYDITFSAMNLQGAAPIYSKGGTRELSLYSTMVYSLAMTAPFEKFVELMEGLEASDPLIRIGSFRLSHAGGEAELDSVNGALSVMILSAKE